MSKWHEGFDITNTKFSKSISMEGDVWDVVRKFAKDNGLELGEAVERLVISGSSHEACKETEAV